MPFKNYRESYFLFLYYQKSVWIIFQQFEKFLDDANFLGFRISIDVISQLKIPNLGKL